MPDYETVDRHPRRRRGDDRAQPPGRAERLEPAARRRPARRAARPPRTTTASARSGSPAPAARSPPARTCATCTGCEEERREDGTPDIERLLARALPPDHHARPRDAEARRWRPSTDRPSGSGCSLALACDLVIAAESAYFLLAFVNIGLVPDGGSSLLVPEPRRLRAGGRDGDARRARSRPRRRSNGASSTASSPTTRSSPSPTRCSTASPTARRAPTPAPSAS